MKEELIKFLDFIHPILVSGRGITEIDIDNYLKINSNAQAESQEVSENECQKKKCGYDIVTCKYRMMNNICSNYGYCIGQLAF